MLPPPLTQSQPDQILDWDRELQQHGVTRIRVDYFEVNGFRYSNPRDAIAEARRHPPHAVADLHALNYSDPARR
jgi:hypothetical protein